MTAHQTKATSIDLTDSSVDPVLRTAVQKLTERFHPKKIYLFGSRANDTHQAESDYDLFLVVETSNLPPGKRMIEAQDIVWELDISADVFIYTEKEFDEWKEEINTIANTVFTEGREIRVGI